LSRCRMDKQDRQTWLNRAYAECTKRGHHTVGNANYHNGACQEGFEATTTVPIHNEEPAQEEAK
jgi:hypothetical protein